MDNIDPDQGGVSRLGTPAPTAGTRRNPLRLAAVGIVGVLAIGAGVFGISTFGDSGGYDDPEAAVQAFFDAVEAEDAIALLESVDPGERAQLRRALDGTIATADRAEITDGVDLDDVQGLELTVSGLTVAEQRFTDRLAGVDLSAGTVEANAAIGDLPFGRTVRDVLGGDVDDPDPASMDLKGLRVMTVRVDGSWYVSAAYTGAEAIRRSIDPEPALPDFGGKVAAEGAPTPEMAVRELATALDRGDVGAMIDLTSPTRAAVLHDYRSMLVHYANLDSAGVTISDVETDVSSSSDGEANVRVTAFSFRSGQDSEAFEYELRDGCLLMTTTWKAVIETEDGQEQVVPDERTVSSCDPGETVDPFYFTFGLFDIGGTGLTFEVVREDGRWFIDPLSSLATTLVNGLEATSLEHFKQGARAFAGAEWLFYSDQLWERCGVQKPGPGVGREAGMAALDECMSKFESVVEYSEDSEDSEGEDASTATTSVGPN